MKLNSNLKNLMDFRQSLGENQTVFWRRFGVTQSGGCRYEHGRNLPRPLVILLRLWYSGIVSDAALKKAGNK